MLMFKVCSLKSSSPNHFEMFGFILSSEMSFVTKEQIQASQKSPERAVPGAAGR